MVRKRKEKKYDVRILKKQDRRQLHGIKAKTGADGILKAIRESCLQSMKGYVKYAEKSIMVQNRDGFVLTLANQNIEG